MKIRDSIIYGVISLCLIFSALAFGHEKTGWLAPESAEKMKNPVKATKASIQKGQEIYEKKCALCHGEKGDGKGFNCGREMACDQLHQHIYET